MVETVTPPLSDEKDPKNPFGFSESTLAQLGSDMTPRMQLEALKTSVSDPAVQTMIGFVLDRGARTRENWERTGIAGAGLYVFLNLLEAALTLTPQEIADVEKFKELHGIVDAYSISLVFTIGIPLLIGIKAGRILGKKFERDLLQSSLVGLNQSLSEQPKG